MAKTLYENYGISGNNEDCWGSVGGLNAITVLAQVFTMGTTGNNDSIVLEEVKLLLSKDLTPSGDLTVEIRDTSAGKPTSVRATGTIPISDIGTAAAGTWLSCTNFVGNLNLAASGVYAIVIGHYTASATEHVEWIGEASGSYAGGAAYYSADNGATWTAESQTISFDFQILGDKSFTGTLCNYDDVLGKIGSGASANAKSAYNVSKFVLQAESLLNARTRKNWTDIYSSLNVDVKYIITEIISDIAASKVINYDMSGYSSRLEAESMISNLRFNSDKLMDYLRDENIQNFMTSA